MIDPSEASSLVQAMIDSIRDNPVQFHFEVTVAGIIATAHGGGTGQRVDVKGGAPGSIATGVSSKVDGPQVQIAQRTADGRISQQMSDLARQLQEIADELEQGSPDRSKIERIRDALLNTWVPNLIPSFLGSLVAKIAWP